MSELDVIGALAGTDKSSSVSWGWDYLRHYEELFARWRRSDINVIEVGVAGGSSLVVWRRFFETAQLVGIDINAECRRFAGEKVAIRIGSQDDPGFLASVAAEFPPTIVIDDGSHIAHHMITTFETLFPALAPGGMYVFEDMAFHFEESARRFQDAKAHQGLSDIPIYDYIAKFMRARAAAVAIPEGSWGIERYAFENIDSVTVIGGLIAVRKTAPRDISHAVSVFERELAEARYERPAMILRYAEYLSKHGHRLDLAASLLSELVTAEPRNKEASFLLLDLLIRDHNLDQASQIANHLTQLDQSNAVYWDRLVGIERRRARTDLEAAALRRLIALQPGIWGHFLRLSELCEDLGDPKAALDAARRGAALEPGNMTMHNRVQALEAANPGL